MTLPDSDITAAEAIVRRERALLSDSESSGPLMRHLRFAARADAAYIGVWWADRGIAWNPVDDGPAPPRVPVPLLEQAVVARQARFIGDLETCGADAGTLVA